MRLDPNIVQQQISNLRLQFPELADDDVLRADTIEGETDAHEFLTRIVHMIDDARALSDGTDGRMKELQARRDRFDRRIEAFRSLAFKIMSAADLPKVELPIATLSIRTGTPKVIITDESKLPPEFTITKIEPNKKAIKEALSNATLVPGAELSNAEPTIAIRVK